MIFLGCSKRRITSRTVVLRTLEVRVPCSTCRGGGRRGDREREKQKRKDVPQNVS